jgi:hypothetical protein
VKSEASPSTFPPSAPRLTPALPPGRGRHCHQDHVAKRIVISCDLPRRPPYQDKPLTEPFPDHRTQTTLRVASERAASCEEPSQGCEAFQGVRSWSFNIQDDKGIPHFTPLEARTPNFSSRTGVIRNGNTAQRRGHWRTHYLPSCLEAQMAIAVLCILPILISAGGATRSAGLAQAVYQTRT